MQYDLSLTIALGESRKSVSWKNHIVKWSSLVKKLETPIVGAETWEEFLALDDAVQGDTKDVGGFVGGEIRGSQRTAENIVNRCIICLDIDHLDANSHEGIIAKVEALGAAYAVYSTRKHSPATPRLRVLIPTSEPIPARFYEFVAKKVAGYISEDLTVFDKSTYQAERLMYWPSVCSDIEYVFAYGDKMFFDPSTFIKEAEGQQTLEALVPVHKEPLVVPEEVTEGDRNNWLFAAGCQMREAGFRDEVLYDAMMSFNDHQINPPLSSKEAETVYQSVLKYEQGGGIGRLMQRAGLVGNTLETYKPVDFTDVGASRVFSNYAKDRAIFCRALGWLVWDGMRWDQDDLKAVSLAKQLTDLTFEEATQQLTIARKELTEAQGLADEQRVKKAKGAEEDAEKYLKFALKQRAQARIQAMVELSKPDLVVKLEDIDSNPFLLNTPDGVVDLRTGTMSEHNPAYLCSKITVCGPSDTGAELWEDLLNTVTRGDEELKQFHQEMAGMAAVGKVFMENMVIAHGGGRNGKSTLYNAELYVMGDYGGTMAPEVLTTAKQNSGANLADLKGKRLVVAAELEDGKRLSTSVLKRVASTDKVSAERKYKDPESFTPTHTMILFTNYLPSVSSLDDGTKRRLVIVPFESKIAPTKEIKNYADYLVSHAGGAILKWIIQGAVMFCQNHFTLDMPESVKATTQRYFEDNDWVKAFMEDCCKTGVTCKTRASHLFKAYVDWAHERNEFSRKEVDFKNELENRGFVHKRETDGRYWVGVELLPRVILGAGSR